MINEKQFEPCTVQAIPDLNVKLMSRYLSYKCVKLLILCSMWNSLNNSILAIRDKNVDLPQLNMKYMAVGTVLCLDLGLHVVNTMFLSLVPLINFLPHIVWFSGNSFCTLSCWKRKFSFLLTRMFTACDQKCVFNTFNNPSVMQGKLSTTNNVETSFVLIL